MIKMFGIHCPTVVLDLHRNHCDPIELLGNAGDATQLKSEGAQQEDQDMDCPRSRKQIVAKRYGPLGLQKPTSNVSMTGWARCEPVG